MVEIRSVAPDEVIEFHRAVSFGFGQDPLDDAALRRQAELMPTETSLVAIDGATIVATFGTYFFELTGPRAATVALGGTTEVTVAATHRRRGILTALMGRHLEQMRELDRPVAGLWASDERIYRRFGYGPAAYDTSVSFSTEIVQLPPAPEGYRLRRIGEDEARTVLPRVYDQVRRTRAGMLSRTGDWWEVRHFSDRPHQRLGTSTRRTVVSERDGVVTGYIVYRQGPCWDGRMVADGTVQVVELVAVDDDARRALWAHVTTIDLFPNVTWSRCPVDDPVFVAADRFRRIDQCHQDTLWLRPLDVPALTAARTYGQDGVIVVELTDGFAGHGGRYRIETSGGAGVAEATAAAADLTLDIADFGALYLGSGTARQLAAGGRIIGRPEAVAALHALLSTPDAPWIAEIF
ncbi:MAG: GNAT family N-acetyltransferase [Acidimicrobiales bacterium]